MTNTKLKKIALVLLITMTITLIVMAVLVHYHNVLGLDVFLSRDLQSEGDTPEKRTAIYHFLYAISLFGKPIIAGFMVAATALLFWFYGYYRETIYVLITPVSVAINAIVKIIVNRPRPSSKLVEVFMYESDKSFPSGHVNFYTVFFGFLFMSLLFTPKIPRLARVILQIFSLFLIVMVSFSRVYLGVHWVTDTIGGYLLGLITLIIILYYYLRSKKLFKEY